MPENYTLTRYTDDIMDPSTQTSTKPQASGIQENSNPSLSPSDLRDEPQELSPKDTPVIYHTKNLYPAVRHIIIILIVIFCVALIIFLMHQNGKSIYDNGI